MEKLTITELIEKVHSNAVKKGFHNDFKILGELINDHAISIEQYTLLQQICINSKLALINTEIAEATEALRKDDSDNFEEELADVVIRCLDLAGLTGFNLEMAIVNKIAKNEQRPYLHGKNF